MSEQETVTTTAVDEYEYRRKKIRRSYINYVDHKKIFIQDLESMLEAIFSQNRSRDWSVRRALQRIINENADLHMDLGNLYGLSHHTKYADKIQKKVVGAHQQRNSLTIPYETVPEITERLQQEREANEESRVNVCKHYNIDLTKDKPEVEAGHENCLKKYQKLLEQLQDKEEYIKRLQQKVGFWKRGEIVLDYTKIEDCLRECYGEPPERFIVTQEEGHAIGVRSA